jgi:HEAT repeat protein
MTTATLQEKFSDQNAEVRRAAALACTIKEDRTLIPSLIGLLNDSEPRVGRAAHAALKALTSQDFGPADNAARQEKIKSVAKWRDWWEQNK